LKTNKACHSMPEGWKEKKMEEIFALTEKTLRPGGLSLTERAGEFCGLARGARVADVGCGMGTTLSFLNRVYKTEGVGFDSSLSFLAAAVKEDPSLSLVRAAAETLPVKDEQFDALFCECTLSLIPDVTKALSEFRRVLKTEGFLVVSDLYDRQPDLGGERCNRKRPATGVLSRDHIESLFEEQGLTSVLWEDHTDELKQMVAQLIFSHGSSCPVLDVLCAGGCMTPTLPAKPGYFLMVGKKTNNETQEGEE
jgi:arsenite methyltransferase